MRMLRRLSLARSGTWSTRINNLQPNQWTLKNMPRLRTRCKALCLPLFVLVSSVPASILLMHDIRSSGFRLLASGVDMVRVSNYGRSSLSYRSIAVKPYATADQHSACHSTAVRLKRGAAMSVESKCIGEVQCSACKLQPPASLVRC